MLAAASLTYVFEQRSRATGPFLAVCLSLSVWMLAAAAMHLADSPDEALFRARLAHVGVAFIPLPLYAFAHALVSRRGLRWPVLGALALLSGGFVVATWLGDWLVRGVEHHPWGAYPRYGPLGLALAVYVVAVLALILGWLLRALADAPPRARSRIRWLLAAFVLVSLSAVDFLPAFGFEVAPFGAVFVLAFLVLITYVTWRYQLVEITASLTGQKVLDTMQEALLVTDAEHIVRLINPAACELLDCSEQAVLGRPISAVLHDPALGSAHARLARGEQVRACELHYTKPVGGARTLALSASTMANRAAEPLAIVHVLTDITERKLAENRVQYLAYFDDLTKLPNRNSFMAQLEQAVESARGEARPIAVYYLDLDNFKRINDTFGHSAGDQLLGVVAERLREFERRYDASRDLARHGIGQGLAYLGGDEFAMRLDNERDLTQILRVGKYLQATLREPLLLNEQEVFVSASIGISRYPQSGQDPQTLLKHANIAMYHAKELGSSSIQIHDESMNAGSLARLDMERDLRLALKRGEFELYYQPQIDVRDGRIFGCEALLRWHHPERGMIAPLEFVGIAEDSGLIAPLGQWVLTVACRQARIWLEGGFDLRVGVNVSARQFHQGSLGASVAQALSRSGLPPRCLDIELTESAIMRNVDQASVTLKELNAMGVCLSLDDFGTGYSSLTYLKRFPIDVIKIDRSFVRDILQNPDDFSITEAIIAMGRSLNRQVIAEGVETEQQAGLLRRLGCNLMQGYLYSPPIKAEDFTVLVERGALIAPIEAGPGNVAPLPGRFV